MECIQYVKPVLVICKFEEDPIKTEGAILSTIFEPPRGKTNKMTVRPAKTPISLGIRPVRSESSLCAQWVAKDPCFFMRTAKALIRLGGCLGWSESSLGAHAILLILSWCGSSLSGAQGQVTPKSIDRCVWNSNSCETLWLPWSKMRALLCPQHFLIISQLELSVAMQPL